MLLLSGMGVAVAETAPFVNKINATEVVLPEIGAARDISPIRKASESENWIKIGKGFWEDPLWNTEDNQPLSGYFNMERSSQDPYKYRFALNSSTYITIHIEDSKRVYKRIYIEPYSLANINDDRITITQKCKENGIDESYYGELVNNKAVIPGNYFRATFESTGETADCSADRSCVIQFPEGFDKPLDEPDNPENKDSGVFLGIIGFNDEITTKPISLLNEESKNSFTSFVDNLQMGNATLLYYAVDEAISKLKSTHFPDNLKNAVLITFTDGLDQGSLAMNPERRTSREYAAYLADRIAKTSIQDHLLEAYAIGLKSNDVYDDELFMYNLQSLASADSDNSHISKVSNIAEMKQKLNALIEDLNRQTSHRIVKIKVPMMSHGDKYRFTLDHTSDKAENSGIWFEGDFNIDDRSLENIVYHGFTNA